MSSAWGKMEKSSMTVNFSINTIPKIILTNVKVKA